MQNVRQDTAAPRGSAGKLHVTTEHGDPVWAKLALKRLSLHHDLSQHSILEQIIIQADEILRQSMSDKECDRYLELTLEPLRSNDGQDVRHEAVVCANL